MEISEIRNVPNSENNNSTTNDLSENTENTSVQTNVENSENGSMSTNADNTENVSMSTNIDNSENGFMSVSVEEERDVNNEGDKSDTFSEIDHNDDIIWNTLLDLNPTNSPLDIAPGADQRPVHILVNKNAEEKSYPTLYQGKLCDSIFPLKTRFITRTRWELQTADRRAASNCELIFMK